MFRKRHLATAIAGAMLLATAAHAADTSPIDNIVVFGDSLSDAGNILSPARNDFTRFTTNPGQVAVQNIADAYDIDLKPSRLGGTDFAFGGSGVVTNDNGPDPAIPTLTQQVGDYLANGATADPRSLYVVWGGANDIFYHSTQVGIGTIFPGAGETQAQATANINAAATQELALVSQLNQAGAKYIVVFNLPNIGATPSAAANNQIVPGIKDYLTAVSQSYNKTLNDGLAATDANVLSVNTYALFNEVLADPAGYGFANVTDQACTTASSHDCNGSTLVAPGADQNYLFADGVHPTTAAQALFSQYVLSELHAPGQTSLLAEAPLTVSTTQTRAVRKQMLADSTGGGSRVFFNIDYAQQRYNGTASSPVSHNNGFNLTLGVDRQSSEHMSFGGALGLAHNNSGVAGGGGFKLRDYSALGYVTWHAGGGYIGGYGNIGHSRFTDVDRTIRLGPKIRRESADTSGWHGGVGLHGGWWFGQGTIRNGPFANVEWESIRVDNFREHGDDSTAMHFSGQHRKALISTLGWRLQGQFQIHNAVLTPYAELGFNRDSKAEQRSVITGLNTLNGNFSFPGFTPDKSWGNVDLGLSARLTPTVTSWIGYNARFSDDSQRYNSVNMGLKIKL